MKKILLTALSGLLLAGCAGNDAVEKPSWLESDSAEAIHARLLTDFPYTFDEGVALIQEKYPELNADSVRWMVDHKYVETMVIDGVERMHRKAVRNIGELDPRYNGGWKLRGGSASPARISYVDSVIRFSEGKLPDGGAHLVHYRFSVDVPYHEALKDDTLRVWMPFPITSDRQSDVRLIAASSPDYVISTPEQSVHSTIFMKAPVVEGENTHFEYEGEFITYGQYFAPADILRNMKPYDTESAEYKKFTTFDSPHIIRLDSLAAAIVGDETNPYRQSELVYDYIINRYPWAGAREYSTIPCIPQYVVESGHGDCGQVALLYISLMRTLGVPARWESGWMVHPGEKNLHDWAEVYYEGTGWVPVDVSFGRYTPASDERIVKFYSTGMDAHRFAANRGVGGAFFPEKRFIRSETVDAQLGEVESTKGNLFYPAWDSHLELIGVAPVAVTK